MQTEIAKAVKGGISIDAMLDKVSYEDIDNYVPTAFAFEMANFIKLVHEPDGTENLTPPVHYAVFDSFVTDDQFIANMMHRGFAKSTVMMYLILKIAERGSLPNFGEVNFMIYISDSMDNGVKTMRDAIDDIWDRSPYLQKVLPYKKTTEAKWVFKNANGHKLTIKGFGAQSGIRGTRENQKRPQIAIIDDVLSDEDSRSPTVCKTIADTLSAAVDYALHPTKRKLFWCGTPFHASDPLYLAVESGQYKVNLYPVAETFPCEPEDFRGSWCERFSYDSLRKQYLKAVGEGKIDKFMREMMLRITSDEDRAITDKEISRYNRRLVFNSLDNFNIYITTDFAVSEKKAADLSFISVWAVSSNGDWYWLDGWCGQEQFNVTMDKLFNFARIYRGNLMGVGVESSGQQKGLINTIQQEMIKRNVFFNLLKSFNSDEAGIRGTVDKFQRFQLAIPYFKNHKIFFPEQSDYQNDALTEIIYEIKFATKTGFKSRYDDGIDTISMMTQFQIYYPSVDDEAYSVNDEYNSEGRIFRSHKEENNDFSDNPINSYLA